MRRSLLAQVLIALVASVGSTRAEWLHNVEDDPFRGGEVHLAMAIATDFSGFVAGFRCSSADDLTLVFVTPEKTKDIPVPSIDKLPVRLLVITDDAEKVALDAKIETTPSGEQFRFSADGEQIIKMLKAAWDAKKRFAIASELLGQVGQSKSFDMRGSSRAIQELVNGCKLKLAESSEPNSKAPVLDYKPPISRDRAEHAEVEQSAPAATQGAEQSNIPIDNKDAAPVVEAPEKTAARCAVVNATPDGFLNLRTGPGVQFPATGKVLPSDLLEISKAECQNDVCDRTHEWVFVKGTGRLADGLGGTTQGWVKAAGTAYIFNRRCGRIPYKVEGLVLDKGRRVVMTGPAPKVDQRCNVIGSLQDTREFTLVPSEFDKPRIDLGSEVTQRPRLL